MSDEPGGKLLQFVPKAPRPPDPGSSYERPILVRDSLTGRYDVVFFGCTTHSGLDVEGHRELIRKAALWDDRDGPALPTGSKET